MTDESYEDQIDRIANNLFSVVDDEVNVLLTKKTKLLQKRLNDLQKNFFQILSSKIIAVKAAPELGDFTPKWKSLSLNASYRSKKIREGRSPNEFYSFTGRLQRSLLQSKAVNAFGTPVVTIGTGGTYRSQTIYQNPKTGGGITSSGKNFSLDKIKAQKITKTISVNLFPDVKENLKSGGKLGFEGEYVSDKIAMKLTNYRGMRNRPILIPFMNWWLNVKATQIIRNTI